MVLFSILLGLSNLAVPVLHFRWQPLKMLRFMCHDVTLCLSLSLLNTLGVLIFILTRRAHFWVTGDVQANAGSKENPGFLGSLVRLDPNSLLVVVVELAVGLALVCIALLTLNMALLGMASAVFIMRLTTGLGWDWQAARPLVCLPLALLVAGAIVSLLRLWGPEGQWLIWAGLAVMAAR